MNDSCKNLTAQGNWPPEAGQKIAFTSNNTHDVGILKEVRWGLVWRDFLLEDGRVVPEHSIVGCPQPPLWREPESVSPNERIAWEERLIAMAEAGMDPQDRQQEFWADLTQYLAYTYLRFKRREENSPGSA